MTLTPTVIDAAAAVSLQQVSKTFPDGTAALAPVTLTVAPGEIVSLVGPSGCGKSTLLRIAAGLIEPTEGRVALARPEIGFVPQDATLLPWRTVAANIELLAQLDRVPKAERKALVADALRLTDLTDFAQHLPRQLSGGMRMRVSLARALAVRPPLFLFDEPFGALDEMTRENLNGEVLRLQAVQGFAGLFVTHSVIEAVYLSHRVVVMSPRPGRIITEVAIPFTGERPADLRFTPEFGALATQVSQALRKGAP